MTTIHEPAREIPVLHEVDICVIGGSCTGVFAAIRAARLGAKVAILEKQNCFGGTATAGYVHIWHSLLDANYENPIIAGLTKEVTDRLAERNACMFTDHNADKAFRMNTEELKIELDAIVREHSITSILHAVYAAPVIEDGRIGAVLAETKSGRVAIRAKVFIDASGDGDLAAHAGIPFVVKKHLQPPTTCARIRGLESITIREMYNAHREEFDLVEDAGWSDAIPGLDDIRMYADTHVFGVNCADATDLTHAEMEGRRYIRAIMDMARKYHPEVRDSLALLGLSTHIGIRETRRFTSDYRITEMDVLNGVRFADAIGNGTYRVDIHNPTGGGYVFKYLDGRQTSSGRNGKEEGRWREETEDNPTCYQIPYRAMVHDTAPNLILAGRTISADDPAYGALRVMVNCNQTGEAAGVAAWLAIEAGCATNNVDTGRLRDVLRDGGSLVI